MPVEWGALVYLFVAGSFHCRMTAVHDQLSAHERLLAVMGMQGRRTSNAITEPLVGSLTGCEELFLPAAVICNEVTGPCNTERSRNPNDGCCQGIRRQQWSCCSKLLVHHMQLPG